jgi:hypothetical protein
LFNDIHIDYLDEKDYWRARKEIDDVRVILHAHWIAFNYFGVLTIDYDEWDDIASNLDRLHWKYPTLVNDGYEAEFFEHWDAEDFQDLPVTPYIAEVAAKMIARQGHSLQDVLEPLDLEELQRDFVPRMMGAA